MTFIVDLDGTLICPRLRIYRVFCALAPDTDLSFDEYWALKMANLSNTRYFGQIL